MTAILEDCSMPALTRRRAMISAKPVGRRWTIQKGGNRGMRRGGERSLCGYGDLRVRTRDMRGDRSDRCNDDTGSVPSRDAESRYCWVTMRAINEVFIR